MAPPKTSLRRLLSDSWLVAHFVEDDIFLHMACVYLQPRKIAFVRLTDRGKSKWGKLQLHPEYTSTGELDVVLDAHLFGELDLAQAKTVKLLVLCSINRMVGDFAPADNVLVEQLPEHVIPKGDTKQF